MTVEPQEPRGSGERGRLHAFPPPDTLRELAPRMTELAWRLTGDGELARDIVQQALLQAWDRREGFEGRSRPSTWLHRIVVNLCRDAGRRARLQEAALRRLRRERVEVDERLPQLGMARDEAARRVEAALRSLPEDEREVLVLRHYQDLPFPEIAAVLGEPVTTIKSRAARGLTRLRERLKDLET